MFLAARAAAIQLVQLGYQRATTSSQRSKLAGHREAIKNASTTLAPGWTDERGKVRIMKQAASGTRDGHPSDLVTVAADLANQKREALLIGDGGAAGVRSAWESLAAVVQSLLADLQPLAARDGRVSRADAAESIDAYLRYFGGAPVAPQLADRLLKLLLAERSLLPVEPEVDQPVEFFQFSANTRTLLAPQERQRAGFGDQTAWRGVPPLCRFLQEFVAGLGLDVGPSGRQRMAGAHPARPAPHPRRCRRPDGGPRGEKGRDLRRPAATDRRPGA